MAQPTIIYLHGLNTPGSIKAQQLIHGWQKARLPVQNLYVPALHHHPRLALVELAIESCAALFLGLDLLECAIILPFNQ